MSDLHEARDPERKSQIDTVGWLFLAFALASGLVATASRSDSSDYLDALLIRRE
jgi:hypothetical protein